MLFYFPADIIIPAQYRFNFQFFTAYLKISIPRFMFYLRTMYMPGSFGKLVIKKIFFCVITKIKIKKRVLQA